MAKTRPRLIPWKLLTKSGQIERMRWLGSTGNITSAKYRLACMCQKKFLSHNNIWRVVPGEKVEDLADDFA